MLGISNEQALVCISNEHGNDSIFHTAVETYSLIAILWHISYFFS